MDTIESKLVSIGRPYFIVGFLIITIVLMIILVQIPPMLGLEEDERSIKELTFGSVLGAVIVAPVLETLIFQKLPIDFFRDSYEKDGPLILISAIPFGLVHILNEFYIRDFFYTFCTGILYAYAYIVATKRKDMNAYLAVVLIHAGYNAFVLIIQQILG